VLATEGIMNRFHVFCYLCVGTLIAAIQGCNEGPTNGRSVEKSPDGAVEILALTSDGQIEHREGRFLEQVRRSDSKLIVVDCWASWCGPCRMLAPILEDLKKDWGDRIEVIKLDVDTNPAIAQHLQVNSIPDVRIFRSGTQIDGFVGLAPKEDIDSMLKRHE
jgi:thioredoxin